MAVTYTLAAKGVSIPSLGLKAPNGIALAHALAGGLPYAALNRLHAETSLPFERIVAFLHIPKRTLARRKAAGKLPAAEAERLVRLALLFERTLGLFEGNKTAAASWLQKALPVLDNQAPLDVAESEIGAREVEDLIGRLEHGVFS